MKKNAIIVGALMFVAAGCAHQGGVARMESDSGSSIDTSTQMSGSLRNSTETLDRNPDGSNRSPASVASQESSRSLDSDRAIMDSDAITAREVEPYDSTLGAAQSGRENYGQGSSAQWQSDKADGSLRGSANWNPSDDLLRDGISTDAELFDTETGIGAAAGSERGSASSGDLNSSSRLEENISGEFDLNNQTGNQGKDSRLFEHADVPQAQVGVTGNEPEHLFNNNRAQGVGSAATGDFGVAESRDPLSGIYNEHQPLAERVKSRLVAESTGTHGLMQHDVARNIDVTAHDGVVTLKGSVPSEKDRKMIEVRAAEISGVKRVVNELVVSPESNPANRNINLGRDLEDRTSNLQD